MAIRRNKTLVKKVLRRDIGLCRCCGFKGSEVHHITPLVFGGTDELKNMVCLCNYCHKHSPNKKEEFFEYMKRGGAKYEHIIGRVINKLDMEGKKLSQSFPEIKKTINILRKVDEVNALENYNLKEIIKENIEDIEE
jgi:hypothetical protein